MQVFIGVGGLPPRRTGCRSRGEIAATLGLAGGCSMIEILSLAVMLADPSQCEAIAKLTLPHTTITSARWVEEGPMAPEGGAAPRANAPPTVLPAHCRVAMVMKPSDDSNIEAEVW